MSQQKIEKWDDVNGNGSRDGQMEAFLDSAGDGYAILQLRDIPETRYERFSSMRELERMEVQPDASHYEVVYTAPLPEFTDQDAMLEGLYVKFNTDRPEDFKGHSLSVSDIVALKISGMVSCHYVDRIGFQEWENFNLRNNYLKNAEMAMEDDYNSIDGILGNNDKSAAAKEDGRASVLEQLKAPIQTECRCARKPKQKDERGME